LANETLLLLCTGYITDGHQTDKTNSVTVLGTCHNKI